MRRVVRKWVLRPHDEAAIRRLAADIPAPPIVAQLLLNRGIVEPAAARAFLDSPLVGLRAPSDLPGATDAAERLWSAAQAGRRVTVYGDYDVDGITGAAILLQALRLVGAPADFYVPHRLEEGYGLNADAVEQLAAAGTRTIVTVDCGIASREEADRARALGVELIVTDHHEFHGALPAADVVVHPRLPGGPAEFASLSGAGVAFKVAWLLCQRASGGDKVGPRLREFLLDALALAALGLVADVMPLLGENRIYVRHGLHRLRAAPSPGLQALMAAAGVGADKPVRAEDIGFRLAPRINAAGRLGCARLCVDLLTTPSADRARELAAFLEAQNTQRQQIERQILSEARAALTADSRPDDPAIVLAGDHWHPGVIGIVAGRLAELYGRPSLVIARSGAVAVGSGRSVPGIDLHAALTECADVLLTHGGHAAAVGFRVAPERIAELRERFLAAVARQAPHGPPAPSLVLDAEVPLSALTPGLVDHIARLEPYGAANPRPKFLAAELQIVGEPRKIGGGERHLSFRVRQAGTTLRAVGWSLAERAEELLSGGGQCSLAFTPRINEWNGQRSVELEVIDFQPQAAAALSV